MSLCTLETALSLHIVFNGKRIVARLWTVVALQSAKALGSTTKIKHYDSNTSPKARFPARQQEGLLLCFSHIQGSLSVISGQQLITDPGRGGESLIL